MSNFWDLIFALAGTVGVIGFGAALFREAVTKFFIKAVEHSFEKRLESFKGEMRDNEKELEQIRAYLVTGRRDHDAAFQAKRFEAAEALVRARDALAQLSMLVEYMKILNTEEILKHGDKSKIIDFRSVLVQPIDVEGKLKVLSEIDKTLPRVYPAEQSLKAFNMYESIVLSAAAMMRIFTIPLRDKHNLVKAGGLSKTIIELVQSSNAGFDRWGEGYVYYWSTYFHDEVLRLLRLEISGADDLTRHTKSIERVAIESRKAQINVRSSLEAAGLPETFMKKEVTAEASSFVA
jgi:hypothetical protein